MLGILYVASAVRKAGAEVFLWDMNYSPDPPIDDVDILMVTANTATWPAACKAAERIKAGLKVVGGPHVTSLGLQGPFDMAVVGEGEKVAEDIARISGHFAFHGCTYQFRPTMQANGVTDVDSLPWPAYDLWPELGQASAVAVEGEPVGPGCSIITSRGCPYTCAFCNEDMWGRQVRFRSVQDVLAEVGYLREGFGITHLRIQDDMANLNKARFAELCWGLRDLGMKWRIHTRTDHVNREEFRLMRECGCVEVGLGVESGSQRMLDLMAKGTTVEDNANAITWAKDEGLHPRAYLIVGFPGETQESVQETVRFIRETRPHRAIVNGFVPYPGSPVWKDPAAYGCVIENQDLDTYWQVGLEDDEGFHASFPSMTRDELRQARRLLQQGCERLGSPDRRREMVLERT